MNNFGNFGSFDAGSALSSLKNVRDTELATDFNEITTGISQNTTSLEDIYGAVQKGGASVVGTGALLKGAYTSFKKWKANRGKKEEGDDDEEGDEADEGLGNEDDVLGQIRDAVSGGSEEAEDIGAQAPREIEMTDLSTPETDVLSTTADVGEADTDLDTLSPYVITTNQTAPFLQRTDATRDLGEDAEEGAEDIGDDGITDTLNSVADGATDAIEDTVNTVGSTVSDALSGVADTAEGAVSDAVSSAGDAISSLTDAASSAVSGAVDAGTGILEGASTAVEAGLGAVAGAGEEALGSVLDASVVGIPLGVILNVIGGITIAGSIGAGVAGDITAGNDEANEMNSAQQTYKNQLNSAITGIQGKYSV